MSRFTFSPQAVDNYMDGFKSETITSSTSTTIRQRTSRRTDADFSEVFASTTGNPVQGISGLVIESPWPASQTSISVSGGGLPMKQFTSTTSGGGLNETVEVRSYWAAEGVASPGADALISPRRVTRFPSFANRKIRVGSSNQTGLMSYDIDMGIPSPCTSTVVEETIFTSGLGLPGSGSHHRRESFLYRSRHGSEVSDVSSCSPHSSRHDSTDTIKDNHSDELIVTPFAQILHTLKKVCNNYVILTNVPSGRSKKYTGASNGKQENIKLSEEQHQKLALETLTDLEWSLEQLETIQTHRSVGELATNKFKRMLSRELNHFAEANKSGSQISEYICSTFFDKPAEIDLSKYKFHESELLEHNSIHGNSTTSSEPLHGLHPGTKVVDAMVIDPKVPADREQMLTISGVQNNAVPTTEVLKYGVIVSDENTLEKMLSNIEKWGADIFTVSELTNKRPLTCLAYRIFKERNLLTEFGILDLTLINYLSRLESHYRGDVKYHNSLHAADVLQSCHHLLSISVLKEVFTNLEILSIIFGAAVHDVDHPGVTNQYLINSGSDLAIMYNDASVLENHHLALAFKLLQNDDSDIFSNLPSQSRQTFRRMTIDVVLATDMSKHMSLLADLKTMVETKAVAGSGILQLDNYNDRIVVLQNIVHCSDLSNPTKPLHLYEQWVDRIMEEFFHQGDMEREQGLDISPMCDRHTANVEKSQIGFIDYIVHPLWETWGELVYPDCQEILDHLEYNRNWYQNILSGNLPAKERESIPVKAIHENSNAVETSHGDAHEAKTELLKTDTKESVANEARSGKTRAGVSPIRCSQLSTASRPYAVRGSRGSLSAASNAQTEESEA